MRKKVAAAALGVAVMTGVVPAARLAAEEKADTILAASRKAIGGRAVESLKTLAVEAELQRNVGTVQMTADVEVLVQMPDKYVRVERSQGPIGSLSTGFNGTAAIRPPNVISSGGAMIIRVGPGGPTPGGEKLSPEEQAKVDRQLLLQARAEISRFMLGWVAMAHPAANVEYTYAGEAESPDGAAHVIDVKNADGFSARLFIDRETNLPLMLTYQGPQPRAITMSRGPRDGGRGGRGEPTGEERKQAEAEAEKRLAELKAEKPTLVEHRLYFEDWRQADGIKFPHTLRRATGGTTIEEWTVNRVKVNASIDPKKFQG